MKSRSMYVCLAIAMLLWAGPAMAAVSVEYVNTSGTGTNCVANANNLVFGVNTACGNAGPDTPWLVKIRPGIYCVSTTIDLTSCAGKVDIEGEGRYVTIIDGSDVAGAPVVSLADGGSLRELTIKADRTGKSPASAVVGVQTNGSAQLFRVEFDLLGDGGDVTGIQQPPTGASVLVLGEVQMAVNNNLATSTNVGVWVSDKAQIRRSEITAKGGQAVRAVYTPNAADIFLYNTWIDARDTENALAVLSGGSATWPNAIRLTNVRATATGTTTSRTVYLEDQQAYIDQSVLGASGPYSRGIVTSPSFTFGLMVNFTRIFVPNAGFSLALNASGAGVTVGGSSLSGTTPVSGTATCVSTWEAVTNTMLSSTCS